MNAYGDKYDYYWRRWSKKCDDLEVAQQELYRYFSVKEYVKLTERDFVNITRAIELTKQALEIVKDVPKAR